MGDDLDERAIFVQGPVVIFKWRHADGWPVEYVSANAVEVFGHAADDFTSGRVRYGDVLHPDDAERVAREVAAGTAAGAPSWTHEHYRIRHKDGSVRWLYDFTRPLRDATGAVTHYLGYVIDISSRIAAEDEARELERRLWHAQKLESLGLLAGGVAHDFNNLLTGILGQASLARERLAGVPGGFRDALDQIELLTRRAAGLTRQLLAYSGKGRFEIEPVALDEVIRGLTPMVEVVLPKGAALHVELAAPSPIVMADRAQLEQVVMNLLTNAAEALAGGGAITIRTRAATRAGEPWAALEVEDTGQGMAPDVVARMFDPFFTTKGAGRGLGMSAVIGIVRAHHGEIHVTSTPGVGTRFVVELPATAIQPPATTPPARPAAPARGTVLVVDDEAPIRTVVADTLAHLGYQVLLAADGAEALALAERDQPLAAAVVDLTMPGLPGAATAAALAARRPELAIVMTSGYSEADANRQLAGVAVRAFLQKPFDLDELAAALASALGR